MDSSALSRHDSFPYFLILIFNLEEQQIGFPNEAFCNNDKKNLMKSTFEILVRYLMLSYLQVIKQDKYLFDFPHNLN